MGANQGRAKGNKQKAEYEESGRKTRETGSERTRKAKEARAERAHRGSHCEAKTGRTERKKQRLSSEMLKRKQTKGSGSQAPAPERKLERGSPVERLRERSRAGRKETNRKPSTGTGKESMRNQAGKNGENQRSESGKVA